VRGITSFTSRSAGSSYPQYFGKDVTSEAGYRRFLLDAIMFDANVPFPSF